MQQQESTIYVIDDNEEVAASLCCLVESVGYPAKAYNDAKSFLAAYNSKEAGCLVLDVRMPEISGLELQERLVKKEINIPIIFITSYADVPMAVRAMKKGAEEFLTKPVNSQVLLEAINKAVAKDISNRLSEEKQAIIQAQVNRLTPREREVMHLVVKGNLSKVIAHKLGISPKTVELHRAKIMEKMEVRAVAELVSKVSVVTKEV